MGKISKISSESSIQSPFKNLCLLYQSSLVPSTFWLHPCSLFLYYIFIIQWISLYYPDKSPLRKKVCATRHGNFLLFKWLLTIPIFSEKDYYFTQLRERLPQVLHFFNYKKNLISKPQFHETVRVLNKKKLKFQFK